MNRVSPGAGYQGSSRLFAVAVWGFLVACGGPGGPPEATVEEEGGTAILALAPQTSGTTALLQAELCQEP